MRLELPMITCDRVLVRMATEEDIPSILDYFIENETYLTPYYPSWQNDFFTLEYWQLQIELNYQEFISDRSVRLFIFLKTKPNKIIGTINFSNFVRGVSQSCTVGYSLAEAQQGKGYMSEAMQGGVEYMFQELKMHRIMANYMPHNRRSGDVLKKLGFVVEGYARDYLMINGKWEDHILTSLVNSIWKCK